MATSPREIDAMVIAIGDHIDAFGFPPSVRDLVSILGLSSTSVAGYRIQQLTDAGLAFRTPRVSRSVVLTSDGFARYEALCAARQAVSA